MGRWVRVLVATLVSGPLLGVLLASVSTEGIGDYAEALWVWLIVVGPFLIYLYGVLSKIGSVVLGIFLLSLTVWAIVVTARDLAEGISTAGAGMIVIPMYGYPAVIVAVVFERIGCSRDELTKMKDTSRASPAGWAKFLWMGLLFTTLLLPVSIAFGPNWLASWLVLTVPTLLVYLIFSGALARAFRSFGSRLRQDNNWHLVATQTDLLIVKGQPTDHAAEQPSRPDR